MSEPGLRSGAFIAPFHPLDEDPALAMRRDLRLIEWLDELGFEEAWIGEHHSGGWEIVASPELIIAAAAERTKRIRLGTGVISLPYHHPLNVADRIVQLDHMTRGRVMFGIGPGLLAADALMRGIDPMVLRERMADAIDVIVRLFAGETVTRATDWYTLAEARLQLLPWSRPRPEIVVSSTLTPSGARIAGRYGFGMLCLAATQVEGYDSLAENWRIAGEIAAENGRTVSPAGLRLAGHMHLAETREKARANVAEGFRKYLTYYAAFGGGSLGAQVSGSGDALDALIANGTVVVGTPDDAIAQLERLRRAQGDFGCFLHQANNWADWDATKRSYELYARHVVPHFRGANAGRAASFQSLVDHQAEHLALRTNATNEMIAKHTAERGAKARPKKDA